MELVYLWVEDYKNIHKQGFNFSPRFECTFHDEYDEDGKLKDGCELEIIEKKEDEYIKDFFSENINVTAIVGKNGSGKSSLSELIFYNNFISHMENHFFILLIKNKLEIHLLEDKNFFGNFNINTREAYSLYRKNCRFNSEEDEKKDFSFLYYSSLYRNLPQINENHPLSYPEIVKKENSEYLSSSINNAIHIMKSKKVKIPINPLPNAFFISLDSILENKDDFAIKLKNLIESESFKYCPEDFYDLLYENLIYKIFIKSEANILDFESSPVTIAEPQKDILELLKGSKSLEELYMKISENEYIISLNKDVENLISNLKKLKMETDDSMLRLNINDVSEELISSLFYLNNRVNNLFKFRWNRDLSSGEEVFLFQFANFYDAIEIKLNGKDNIIILIDEGETTLHPQWQKMYIKYMIDFFKDNFPTKSFHLIVTTHSPFLLSDIPKQNIIFLDKDEKGNCKVVDGLKEKKQTFGANIHTLLSDSFFMEDGLMGEFAKSKINEIKRFYELIQKLKERINKNPRSKNLAKKSYIKRKKRFKEVQKIIGEPFLQTVIKNYLDEIENILFEDKAKKIAIERFIKEFGKEAICEVINNVKD